MDKETHTFSKDASSYSPFNSIYTIQLGFKEKEVDETELEFNVSSTCIGPTDLKKEARILCIPRNSTSALLNVPQTVRS